MVSAARAHLQVSQSSPSCYTFPAPLQLLSMPKPQLSRALNTMPRAQRKAHLPEAPLLGSGAPPAAACSPALAALARGVRSGGAPSQACACAMLHAVMRLLALYCLPHVCRTCDNPNDGTSCCRSLLYWRTHTSFSIFPGSSASGAPRPGWDARPAAPRASPAAAAWRAPARARRPTASSAPGLEPPRLRLRRQQARGRPACARPCCSSARPAAACAPALPLLPEPNKGKSACCAQRAGLAEAMRCCLQPTHLYLAEYPQRAQSSVRTAAPYFHEHGSSAPM